MILNWRQLTSWASAGCRLGNVAGFLYRGPGGIRYLHGPAHTGEIVIGQHNTLTVRSADTQKGVGHCGPAAANKRIHGIVEPNNR